jgi:cephalosporin hydroxylase
MATPLNYSNCKTLDDAFAIRQKQCDDIAPHEGVRDEMLRKYSKGCAVVKELGVWQGITLAMFLVQEGVEEVIGVDISFKKYKAAIQPLADAYAKEHGKKVTLLENSSHDTATVSTCDFMHIDSVHTPTHLLGELRVHASSVNKYIAFHDVNQKNRELYRTIVQWMKYECPMEWKIVEDYDKGKCGCTIIERVK